jgi:15-cis-phytoene synthase
MILIMKHLFDEVSTECSKITMWKYSTSFSLGILLLKKRLRIPIYSIYGFVRFADEIVDSFHAYDKKKLLDDFRRETYTAIQNKISLNPILNSFQEVVHRYEIPLDWVDTFLNSMEMDLYNNNYCEEKYKKYILGSAEVVGLMCLRVFTEGNENLFDKLKCYAIKLGAAFQKVNFLRDIKADNEELGRMYFPNVDLKNFSSTHKIKIENEIENDFAEALKGIRLLPKSSRSGVFAAYCYYAILFKKIKRLPPYKIWNERVRISNSKKILLLFQSGLRHKLNMI